MPKFRLHTFDQSPILVRIPSAMASRYRERYTGCLIAVCFPSMTTSAFFAQVACLTMLHAGPAPTADCCCQRMNCFDLILHS